MAKLNYLKAKQMGASDDQIMQYAQTHGMEIKLPDEPKPEKKGRGLLDLLSVATSIGGGALGSAIAPGIGTVAGSAIGGGLGQFLEQKIAGEKTDLGDIVNEGLWSGAGGLAGLGIGKLLGGAGKGLASEVTRGTLAKNLPKGTAIGKIDELAGIAASKGAPTGSYVAKARGFQNIANEAKTARTALAGTVTDTIPRNQLIKTLKAAAMDTGLLDTKEATKLNFHLNKLPKGESVGTKDILAWLEGLAKPAGPTYKATPNATAIARAARALKDSGNEVLNKYLPEGEMKSLTTKIGQSIPLTEAYTNAAREGSKIPFLGTSIPLGPLGRPVQAGIDYSTRAASSAGNSQLLQQLLGQTGARAAMPKGGDVSVDSSIPTGGEPADTTPENKSNNLTDLLQKLALADAMQGGKNVNKLIALSKFISPPPTETQKGQVAQIEAANGLIDQLETAYLSASKKGQTGFGVGPLAGLLGGVSGGALDQEAALYNSLRQGFTALIARATGERGVLTDADAQRALQLIPGLNDSPQLAANKINQIRQVFSNAQARIGASSSGGEDIMSLLQGLQ